MEDVLTAQTDAEHATLIAYYNESVDASRTSREKAERDRDYYDGKQLTADEEAELKRRGQPPIALNVIRARVDYLQGLEKKQRGDPKGYPRNPEDQEAADAFTDGMRYAADAMDYPALRSAAWKNIIVEGCGGVELTVVPRQDGDADIEGHVIPWDRLIYDPHSTKPDFSDGRYLGQVLWLDRDEALERAVANGADEAEAADKLDSTLSFVERGDTFDDKPKDTIWADPVRKRVRIVVLWCKKGGEWTVHEFTRGGVLSSVPSPYVSKDGESLCPVILESAYVDRDNNRYGVVRDLIDPQDEINRRRSKALHLLNTTGVIAETGAVTDVNKTRRELARPDFYVEVMPNARFEIVRQSELAAGQSALGEQAMGYVMQSGPNAALLGKGTEDQSGKAIEAQQAGGLIELGDLLDALRRFDRRVFKLMAAMMQQFWTAEKWIRVTDDELSPQYVGLNVPIVEQTPWGPMQLGTQNAVAELDVDVIVAEAPDSINNTVEAYTALSQVMSMAGQVPPPVLRIMIEAHPSLPTRRKKQLLDMLEQMMGAQQQQPDPMQQQMAQAQMERQQADTEKVRADTFKAVAQGEEIARRSMQPQVIMPGYPPGMQ